MSEEHPTYNTDIAPTPVEFERYDVRRTWLVLAAIATLERPTIASVNDDTGLGKTTVQRIAKNLATDTHKAQYLGLCVTQTGPVFSVKDWGALNKKSLLQFYKDYKKTLA